MIVFENVEKIYTRRGREVHALDGVSLSVERGSFTAVRGPSGCGKSTLLSLAGLLTRPTRGVVYIDGTNASSLDSAAAAALRAARIGFVFQMYHLVPYLNVLENVILPAEKDQRPAARRKASELLEKFGLSDRATHLPGELSVGQRQRAAMARALLNAPEILLADEPTGNLDPQTGTNLLEIIADFHRSGGTVLLVTHDDRAAGRADRILELDAGRLVSPVNV